jgi:hypothetical protein
MHQRRQTRRMIFALVAVMLLLVLVPLGVRGAKHLQLLYWQGRALTTEMSADAVMWDAETAISPGAHPTWARFYELLSPPGGAQFATLFLHGRDAGAGQRLLVVDLHLSPQSSAEMRYISVSARVIEPGTLTRRPRDRVHVLRATFHMNAPPVRIFAGQPDPVDPSHFTIVYITTDHAQHMLDGWLLADDTVVIERRPAE